MLFEFESCVAFKSIGHCATNFRCNFYQIFSEESQENVDFEHFHLMGVLFKHFQYWLTE